MSDKSNPSSTKAAASQRKERRSQKEDLQVHPAALGALFAKRPLVLGEHERDYDELMSKVTAAMKPEDIIEAVWAKDITDLMWEAQRLRRVKASLLTRGAREALVEQLQAIDGADVIDDVKYSIPSLVACYAKGLNQAVTHMDGIFASHGFNSDDMTTRAFAFHMDQVEQIERMIAGIDARRNRVIGEYERYRDGRRRHSRRIAENVTDIS